MSEKDNIINVSAPPYNAAGDGITNDRAAIQRAIDDAYTMGGGTVELTAGKTFLSAPIVIRSGVTLLFGDDATLRQSGNADDYYKPSGGGYERYTPIRGHNYSDKIKWSHCWYKNYPMIFAPEGSHGFAIRGNGVIRMMDAEDPAELIKICPIGFYRCRDFAICDIHITNYHSYAIMPFTSRRGLFRNVKISDWCHGNGDGICLMNCSDIRVTGCDMYTGDDSVYIFSSYRDPRGGEWWSSDEPEPSVNIEIDHNRLKSNHCKAFGMILWGIDCPDKEKVEVRDVSVHDNYIESLGVWLYNPYSDRAGNPPVTGFRWSNNTIRGIESNFFETQITDTNHFQCTRFLQNGFFEDGKCFWTLKPNKDPDSVFVCRNDDAEEAPYACLTHLEAGGCAVYQGVYLDTGRQIQFKAETKAEGAAGRLFVRDLDSGKTVATLGFDNPEWKSVLFNFSVPKSGNYHIGMESACASDGRLMLRRTALANHENAFGYNDIYTEGGKILYVYNNGVEVTP